MSIVKKYIIGKTTASMEDGALETPEFEVDGMPAESNILSAVTTITEVEDETREVIAELTDALDAEESSLQLEDKIEELTELVNDESQDIEHVTAIVESTIGTATEMFRSRWGVDFKSEMGKLALAKESLGNKRSELRAALEDTSEKNKGFLAWVKSMIDKAIKWFLDLYKKYFSKQAQVDKEILQLEYKIKEVKKLGYNPSKKKETSPKETSPKEAKKAETVGKKEPLQIGYTPEATKPTILLAKKVASEFFGPLGDLITEKVILEGTKELLDIFTDVEMSLSNVERSVDLNKTPARVIASKIDTSRTLVDGITVKREKSAHDVEYSVLTRTPYKKERVEIEVLSPDAALKILAKGKSLSNEIKESTELFEKTMEKTKSGIDKGIDLDKESVDTLKTALRTLINNTQVMYGSAMRGQRAILSIVQHTLGKNI